MNNLNSVLLEGNMVRDPLIRSTQKGTSLCTFTIASNRYYHQDSNLERETGFFDVEAWVKIYFLYPKFSSNLNLILTELENIVNFLEEHNFKSETEKEEYFELTECLFDVIEEVYFKS